MSQSKFATVQALESRRLLADFSVAFTADTIPDAAKAGDKLKAPSATFSVASSGELTKDQGKAKLTLDVAITGNGTTVNAKQIKITASQLAKKAKVAKAVFSSLKVAPAAGTYTITATLGGDLATGGDTNTANNSASTTFTVASGGTSNPGSSNPFSQSQVNGSIFTFKGKKVGARGIFTETGTWSNDAGATGTYKIDFGTGIITNGGAALIPNAGSGFPFILKFVQNSGTISKLNGKITFGVSEGDAKGYAEYAGGKVYYK